MKKLLSKEDQENYDECKQNILEYTQMLIFQKDNEEETEWIKRRIDFNITMMLHLMKKKK
jgi:hypothetical protein